VTDPVSGAPDTSPSRPPPEQARRAEGPGSSRHATARTRISGTWVGIVVAAVVLVLLLVFVLQNTRSVKVSYLGASGQIPLGVVLLLATVGGVLLSGAVASLRIMQIRRRLGRQAGTARPAAGAPVEVPTLDQGPRPSGQFRPDGGTPEQ
jgi:putative membrane protein